jgi:acylphosphatase
MERRAVIITGRVQGVGFRWWTRRQAERLGVGGTVRNLEDGSVFVELAGASERVDALLAALRSGPPGAAVEDIAEVSPSIERYTGFRIVG